MRLNRYLAACGLGSRRSCEELIQEGRVVINGERVAGLAVTVGPQDVVRVSGRAVSPPRQATTLILNKPPGFVSTRSDERGRKTVYDLLPPGASKLFHVGRLDRDSEGLMVLTDDGALAQRLSHPSYGISKEYEVTLDRPLDDAALPKLLRGFVIEGGRARMESLRIIRPCVVRVVLTQGIKRQIRLMFYRVGFEVRRLVRIRLGGLILGSLSSGEWRVLSPSEIALLGDDPSRKPQGRKERPLRNAVPRGGQSRNAGGA